MRELHFTPGGLSRLRRRLAAAHAAYQAVCDSNPEALEAGDNSGWHDNFAYEENQRQMHQLARRVRDLGLVLAQARMIELPRGGEERVAIGTRVTYELEGDLAPRTCWIASWDDGDPAASRVSYNSPLGRALLGAAAGDSREMSAGGKARTVTVLIVHGPVDDECDRAGESWPAD